MKKLACWLTVALLLLLPVTSQADTWAAPGDTEYLSENAQFRFEVKHGSGRRQCRGVLSRLQDSEFQQIWEATLVNRTSPVQAMVHDSGRFVVTFDEWASVGTNPIVIYGTNGELLANLSLSDLGLRRHPLIAQSVSSYWWNESAIMLFGPEAGSEGAEWRHKLEDSLFIRLHWGDVLAIDLNTGNLTDEQQQDLSAEDAMALAAETDAYLNRSFRQLADEYLREENFFDPDPTSEGIQGILLSMQLGLHDALPLLQRIADTDRFESWGAPKWSEEAQQENLQALARAAIAAIEERDE